MWNLKYDASELVHEPETDSQTQGPDVRLQRASDGGGVAWEFEISRYRLLNTVVCIQTMVCI